LTSRTLVHPLLLLPLREPVEAIGAAAVLQPSLLPLCCCLGVFRISCTSILWTSCPGYQA
jgi:hypothetical protein